MPLLKINDETIERAAAVLSGGGLVAFPTETVYGLGADAFNRAAVAKIFEVKNRPRFDPLIVHISDLDMLEKTADLSLLDPAARKMFAALTEKFWPGPLTLVLPKQKAVPDIVTSGLPTVAVRFPEHGAARKLIALFGGPVAAPSANPFGYLSPTRAEHVLEMLGDTVDLILDGGPANVGLESTVLDICTDRQGRILRPGGVPAEAIEALIGKAAAGPTTETAEVLPSPGMLKSHYAPRTPLSVYAGDLPDEPGAALLFFDGASRDAWLGRKETGTKAAALVVLSETGNLLEAAAKLFEILHDLDSRGVKRIHARLAPEEGPGVAINDRLRRAASD